MITGELLFNKAVVEAILADLQASALMALYSIRSERQFCERLRYDLLFKVLLRSQHRRRGLRPQHIIELTQAIGRAERQTGPLLLGRLPASARRPWAPYRTWVSVLLRVNLEDSAHEIPGARCRAARG